MSRNVTPSMVINDVANEGGINGHSLIYGLRMGGAHLLSRYLLQAAMYCSATLMLS